MDDLPLYSTATGFDHNQRSQVQWQTKPVCSIFLHGSHLIKMKFYFMLKQVTLRILIVLLL